MREILEKRIKEVEHNVNKMKEWESVIQRNIHGNKFFNLFLLLKFNNKMNYLNRIKSYITY